MGATTTKIYTTTTKKSKESNNKVAVDTVGNGLTIKTELGWGNSDEDSETTSTSISWTDKDDELIDVMISYNDKYIKEPAAGASFNVYSYSNDRFTFTILPYRY